MPLMNALSQQRFSARGPVPRPLNVGTGLAVMLLCLQNDQSLVAPSDDAAETVFTVIAGRGVIREGDEEHQVNSGDVVHVPSGTPKALLAQGEQFVVLGVRRMADRSSARTEARGGEVSNDAA